MEIFSDLNHTELVSLIFIVLIAAIITCQRKNFVSSDKNFSHAFGLALKWKDLAAFVSTLAIIFSLQRISHNTVASTIYYPTIVLSYLIYTLWVFKRFVKVFKFDNRRKDSYNHLLQTMILLSAGAFIIFIILHFKINDKSFLPFSLCAAVLGFIFNDSIKGIIAYFHLRANNLLHIGDWIEVPNQNIDGIIINISLVTVTVRNWDNTVSNISISTLQNGAFKNNQDVLDGKTSGRRMYRSFIIDTRSIKSLSVEDIASLKRQFADIGEDSIIFMNYEQNKYTSLNIYLYRMYLRHWLMNNPQITRYPRLLVRLLEPTSEGIPLQIYAYIRKTSIMPYELVQSSIVEHILLSINWFGLRLYQKPSGKDIANLLYKEI